MYGFDWALSPGKVVHLDASTKEQLTWLDSDLTDIKVDQLSLPRRLEWRSADGSRFDVGVFTWSHYGQSVFAYPTNATVAGGCLVSWRTGKPIRPRFMGRYNFLTTEEQIVLYMPECEGSRGYGKKVFESRQR